MNAVEAHAIAKKVVDASLEAELQRIHGSIEAHAKKGNFDFEATLSDRAAARLRTQGFHLSAVDDDFDADDDIVEYKISWSKP